MRFEEGRVRSVSGLHVSVERLKRFLLYREPLFEDEHFHLDRCELCTDAMVRATIQEIQEKEHVTN